MPENPAGTPLGIPKFQLDEIRLLADQYVAKSSAELIEDIDGHVALAATVKKERDVVNLKLATLIGDRLKSAITFWDELTDDHKYWMCGAIGYFAASDDEEDDFRSPIGFEDDAEIFNACVRFAGHKELVITKEEF